MRRLGVMLALSGAAVWLTGCNKVSDATPAARGGIAVVDLDAVGKAIGRDQFVRDAVAVRQNALKQELVKIGNNINSQLAAKKSEMGEEPTAEQQLQLSRIGQDAQQKFNVIKAKGDQALASYSRNVVAQVATELRDQIRPLCQKIAAEKGLGIVVPKNEGFLLSIDPGVDITEEVIAALKASGTTPKASAAAIAEEPVAEEAAVNEIPEQAEPAAN